MYYSSGNYEAFAHPLPPEGVENKQAYIIGSGLAGLAAACFLVRDGRMPGEKIHILERDPRAGGGCDGWEYPGLGFTMRGGREMDNHFEVMGSVPRHSFHRGSVGIGARLLLLVEQARSELLAVPRHAGSRPGRPY
ncbi:MAG: oleate hydratase [Adlercreutzia equolifaciens]